jgi:hypothetical protein
MGWLMAQPDRDPIPPSDASASGFRPPFPLGGFPFLFALLILPGVVSGQTSSPPTIEEVHVGLPSGAGEQTSGRTRDGVWAPIYVRLKAGPAGNSQGAFQIVASTTDGEDAPYRYTVAVPALTATEERIVVAYLRPGNAGSEFTAQLQDAGGGILQTKPRIQRDLSREVLNPPDVLFLAVGSRLPGLRRANLPLEQAKAQEPDDSLEDHGSYRFANVDRVAQMPDRWFGYDAADVVVLATSGHQFVTELLEDSAATRRNALVEWVRRGGRAVVSLGVNQQEVSKLLEKMPLLNCSIKGKVTRKTLPIVGSWSGPEVRDPLGPVEIAELTPGAGTAVLVRERPGAEERVERPLLIQGSCGLGRVLLVAFDLDSDAFTRWSGQLAFWKKLRTEIAPPLPLARAAQGQGPVRERMDIATELKRGLETFEHVPVISFGWVALFILFYIVLVGPLDYFILKKVFKRLEYTWLTFPTIVLLVSIAAYWTAYSLKGDDLRVNKIDLVEIDLHNPREVLGTTWLTLFSPRSQRYTLGVEPATTWAPAATSDSSRCVVATLAGPEPTNRSTSQGPYDYAEDASGIERIPVSVWATRSFTAAWRRPLSDKPAPIEAELRRSRLEGDDQGALIGAITNNLPVALQAVTLFYRGKWYGIPDLVPGQTRRVESLFEGGARAQVRDLNQWFTEPTLSPGTPLPGPLSQPLPIYSAYKLFRPMLFHTASEDHDLLVSGLHRFDQSWRLRPQPEYPTPQRSKYRDEVILVGRTALLSGHAEEVLNNGVCPTSVWLGALPGPETARPSQAGFLTQEAYVRVYVPVQTSR